MIDQPTRTFDGVTFDVLPETHMCEGCCFKKNAPLGAEHCMMRWHDSRFNCSIGDGIYRASTDEARAWLVAKVLTK